MCFHCDQRLEIILYSLSKPAINSSKPSVGKTRLKERGMFTDEYLYWMDWRRTSSRAVIIDGLSRYYYFSCGHNLIDCEVHVFDVKVSDFLLYQVVIVV
ncbi:hypothetical protein CMV_029548 [Castanea mollissima]|uniref:Uncharacterized protein n=1 Tax=Castanea mollissima TaxID=60419 RepID=A0A8J4Q9L1_9ROSI|nr:hypothetical protein CMV_029548 [Castanea mollissima]